MTTRTVTVQPAQQPDGKLPFPYFISEDASIGRQDYWKGAPLLLVGFQARFDVQNVDVGFEEFWANPDVAVGKYAILEDAEGDWATWLTAIERVRVSDDEQVASA